MTSPGVRAPRRQFQHLALAVLLPLLFSLLLPNFSRGADSAEPEGWSVSGSLRLRAEHLADSFRLVAPESDTLLFSRLQLRFDYRDADWFGAIEVQDSRAWGDRRLSPIGTDDVNTLEPVNLYLGRRWTTDQSQWSVVAGRMTMDYGSRRLLARNRFRNTSNAFQMLRVERRNAEQHTQLFYSYPLQREPGVLDRTALRDNRAELDKAGRSERFWGVTHDGGGPGNFSLYYFDAEFTDRPGRPVADRHLHTAGGRVHSATKGWRWDLEGAYQWGRSTKLLAPGSADVLDHRAYFGHMHLGRELTTGLQLELGYDIASGDSDPEDQRNGRFDRLYGARAFDLGPSGIFGAAVRSNLRSPFLRLRWTQSQVQSWLFSVRNLRLHSARDLLPTAARLDGSGASGDDLGLQFELRWRWAAPGPWKAEIGAAYLRKGEYFDGSNEGAPLNPPSPADTRYVFTQLSWEFQ